MAVNRLKAIRQITKGAGAVKVWLLIDVESNLVLGVYSDENRAWEQASEVCDVYGIETRVLDQVLDLDCLEHRRVG